jgi:hypothetical protein
MPVLAAVDPRSSLPISPSPGCGRSRLVRVTRFSDPFPQADGDPPRIVGAAT